MSACVQAFRHGALYCPKRGPVSRKSFASGVLYLRPNRMGKRASGWLDPKGDNQPHFEGASVDIALLIKAAIMGIVEGLTEFLPISSTGHLILAGALLGFDDEKAKVFDIAIQTGAIFAVILVYWQKIRDTVVALPTDKTGAAVCIECVDCLLASRGAGSAVWQGHQGAPVHAGGGGQHFHHWRFYYFVG